jgi:hypothetical protein
MGIKVEQIVAKGKVGTGENIVRTLFASPDAVLDGWNRTGTKRFKMVIIRFKSIKLLISLIIFLLLLALPR